MESRLRTDRFAESTCPSPWTVVCRRIDELRRSGQRNPRPRSLFRSGRAGCVRTPALTLFSALEAQLKSIAAEGLEARWARHKAMASRTQDWVTKISDETGKKLSNIAPLGSQSPTVSAIRLPSDLAAESFTAAVARRGIVVGNGYGKLKSSTFRIGHMGDHTLESLERCLAACSTVLHS